MSTRNKHTINIQDEAWERLTRAAKAENRNCSNMIETMILKYVPDVVDPVTRPESRFDGQIEGGSYPAITQDV